MREQTTFTLPPDITKEIRQLKKDKDLPSLWRAVQVYFDEKQNKEIRKLQKLLNEQQNFWITYLQPWALTCAITQLYFQEHKQDVDISRIITKAEKLLKPFSPEIQKKSKENLREFVIAHGLIDEKKLPK